jgi:hypothetical protein
MELSKLQQRQLTFDRDTLKSLGLKMLTEKYTSAVYLLAKLEQVSPYFFHLHAARGSQEILYSELKNAGYSWSGNNWKLNQS